MRIKRPGLLIIMLSTCLLVGCGIFPKEEELQKTPIIQAYEQEPFRKAKVQKGNLKLYEKIDTTCMSIGEKQYTFKVSDRAFQGIYVTLGEQVQAGQLLAELVDSNSDSNMQNSNQLQITAEENATVTFVKDLESNEKSVAGQIIVTTNTSDGYYLNAFTQYWDRFPQGEQVIIKIRGKEYSATAILAEDLGLPPSERPENPEEPSDVYFHIEDESAFLQSGDKGEVNLLVADRQEVLYIPKGAVTTVNDQEIVYVEDQNGIRSVKYIKTGIKNDRYIEVVSGLEEGDSVILE